MPSSMNQRRLTADEYQLLENELSPSACRVGRSIGLYAALAIIAFLAQVVAVIAIATSRIDDPDGPFLLSPSWPLAALVLGICLVALLGPAPLVLRSHRTRTIRDRARHDDVLSGVVDVIEIEDIEAEQHVLPGRALYCFALTSGHRLLLTHPVPYISYTLADPGLLVPYAVAYRALMDESTADRIAADAAVCFLPFPSQHFVIHRLPHSGRILHIEFLGAWKIPIQTARPDAALQAAMNILRARPDLESILLSNEPSAPPAP